MLIREFEAEDLQEYLMMSKDFFNSEAVEHAVPEKNWQVTFKLIMDKSPFAKGWILLDKDIITGYLLISLTWSNEIGGMVAWVEEFYIKPEYRGKGLGKLYLQRILQFYDNDVKRFRLELTPTNVNAEKLYLKLGFVTIPYRSLWLGN